MKRSFDFKALTIGAGARRSVVPVLISGLLLSACTALPEWTDPGGWFSEDTPPPSQISAAKDLDRAKSGEFPNLASVPDQPRAATSKGERAVIAETLAADRANARYSGERLVAGGSSAPAAPAIAQDLSAATTPVPAPAPIPVQAPSAASLAPAPASPGPAQGSTKIAQALPKTQTPAPRAAAAPPLAQPRISELAGIIYFAHGSDSLNANDRNVLRDIVALSQERDARIRVIGHASARTGTVDAVAHRIANLEASQRRAEAVTAAMVRMGARRDRIRTEARADTLPVYHEFMPTGEAGNRRAEIFLEY